MFENLFPSCFSKKFLKFSPTSQAYLVNTEILSSWCNTSTKICLLFHLWDGDEICKYSQIHFSLCGTVKAESVTLKYFKSTSETISTFSKIYHSYVIIWLFKPCAEETIEGKVCRVIIFKEYILNHIPQNSWSFKKKRKIVCHQLSHTK